MNTNSRHRYIDHETDDGLSVRLYPVRLALIELSVQSVKDELRAEGVILDPPSYTINLAGGATEEIEHIYDPEHNLDTLTVPDDPAQTAVNFSRWRKYQAGLVRLAEAEEDRRLQEVFKQGVEFDWPDDVGKWENEVRKRSYGKIDPPPEDGTPETEATRKWMWLWFCHLSAFDVQVIRNALNLLAQGRILDEEQFRQLKEGLRSGVAKQVWAAFESIVNPSGNAEPAVPDVVPDA